MEHKNLISIIAVLIIFTLPSSCGPKIDKMQLYIAPDGSDANSGTIDKPLLTLQRARDAVRTLKREKGFTGPVEIILREGVYYLSETLVLEPVDSGLPDAPITWRSASGERVILSGGREFEGNWQKDAGGIWHIDLHETKEWIRNSEIAEVYRSKPEGPWHFRQLFVNGQRSARARYPNADEQNPFLYATGGSMEHVQLPDGQVRANWGKESDAQINIVANWRFFNQWNDVVAVDSEKSVLHIGPRERHGKIIDGNWFWIEGIRTELDQPGEWYLDPHDGRLYYMPDEGHNPNSLMFVAPYLNRIVYLKGDAEADTHVEYVNFEGLEFRHTTFTLGHIEARVHTDAAVMLENASHCRIEMSHFENIGGYALWLHLDCQYNSFHNNTVQFSGGGGVLMTGSRLSYMDDTKIFTPGEKAARVAPMLNRITNNTVNHCGKIRYYGGGVHIDSRPKSMAMMPGNYIAHNHFHDLSRNGIFTFRNQGGNVVEYNHIHDCLRTTIDGAAIHFASMNRLNAPNYILNNYLYNVWGYEQKPHGEPIRHPYANGVFLDWATSNTTVKNNYIYNTGSEDIKAIMGNWELTIEENYTSKTRIEPPFLNEIGPEGTATHGLSLSDLILTGGVISYTDKNQVTFNGNWETAVWDRRLFRYKYLKAKSDKPAEVNYKLPISEPGTYKICLIYLPGENNATNASLNIIHADGQEESEWNMKEGDELGFALEVGKYRFDPEKPARITISNSKADGDIIADAVAFIKMD